MIIVLILISIVIFIWAWITYYDDVAYIAIGAFIIEMIALVCVVVYLLDCSTIDNKIELYQTQNLEIENKVAEVVKRYMEHENITFTELKPNDSYITLVTLYPELKSNKLIEKEINLYEENNKKIIELKEQKINERIYKWWLYFGK